MSRYSLAYGGQFPFYYLSNLEKSIETFDLSEVLILFSFSFLTEFDKSSVKKNRKRYERILSIEEGIKVVKGFYTSPNQKGLPFP